MWHAMPPQNNMLHHSQQSASGASSSSSAPRPPDPERVNVHHFQHGHPQGSAPAAAPPMMGVPYPYPMPSPAPQMYPYPAYPPPPPPSCHGHCHNQYPMHHQQHQQQPQFVVYQQDKENAPPNVNKQDEKKPEEKKPEPPKEQEKKPDEEKATQSKNEPPPPPPEKKAQKFSKFSVASVIIFALALIFGTVCTVKTYQANDERIDGYEAGIIDTSDNKVYQHTRKLALGMGCTSAICFTIATLCSFYAGLRHNSYATRHNRPRPKEHCCLAGFVISGWIIFCLTFINNLIIAVLAFDSNNTIYPEVVFVGFMGSLCSWVLMFGYSELARRAG